MHKTEMANRAQPERPAFIAERQFTELREALASNVITLANSIRY